jgi:ABC-2 type transport system permease protein
MREILKHLRIWLKLIKLNFMSQMEYRANFMSGILMEAGYLFAKIMYVIVAYRAGREIAGFGPDEIIVFVGTYVAITGFYAGLLATNLFQLSDLVRGGSFDLMLVKPINTQFYATFRRSEIGALLFDTVAGIAMVAVGLARIGAGFSILGIFGWALFAASGAAVGYALWVIPISFVFRIVRADAIAGFADAFWDFNNVPMIVYGKWGRAIGMYAIPIFVVTNFPALFALGRMSPLNFIWGLAAPVIFCFIASLFWRSGIKHYESGGN